jgi:hypothetical protein
MRAGYILLAGSLSAFALAAAFLAGQVSAVSSDHSPDGKPSTGTMPAPQENRTASNSDLAEDALGGRKPPQLDGKRAVANDIVSYANIPESERQRIADAEYAASSNLRDAERAQDFLVSLDVVGELAVKCKLRGEHWRLSVVYEGQKVVAERKDLAIAQAMLTPSERGAMFAHMKWTRKNLSAFYQNDCNSLTKTDLLRRLDLAVLGMAPLPYGIDQ